MPTEPEPLPIRPVILVHLDTAPGAKLTACSGVPFEVDNGTTYLNVPRMLCPGCANATRGER